MGMVGSVYSFELLATGGEGAYTWTSTELPKGLVIDSSTGIISGKPDITVEGNNSTYTKAVTFTIVDETNPANMTASITLDLHVSVSCGNGGFLISPKVNSGYDISISDEKLPEIKINSLTGFNYFEADISKVNGHTDDEVVFEFFLSFILLKQNKI